ncbi:MAG: UDP-N-acetylmuramoyl-L-alanine--D-glutamate ligase [Pseudomonadota bacterium]|nr:MAG: UDP-N-acetylmuramoyl-L-alanine--D-glutamate ligase [Pseudomonadota bacterium]
MIDPARNQAPLAGRRVIVVGLKKSGIAAAELCRAEGAEVLGTDREPRERLDPEALALGIEIVAGGHAGVPFESADLVVVSPGVPPLPELERAARAGVPVVGELELAAQRLQAPIVAIGGTNGKSTTTTLVGDMVKAAGRSVFVGGNLGTPATRAVGAGHDVVVLEVSSFQLERAPSFRPKVSVLLGISEDHLDRYPSFAAYAAAKGNAFVNQTADDVAIVPAGDAECERQARRGHGRLVRFGGSGDYVVEESAVLERASGERFAIDPDRLSGRHNRENAAAAIAAARAVDTASAAIGAALSAFRPLPHRMAFAGSVRGVRFYDDSKGTNVGAAVTALRGLAEAKAVLIAGGRDKQGAYEPLVAALAERGRAVVLIGEAAERIAAAVGDRVPVARAGSMEEAVQTAFALARPGDAVLLSPACASFDMFRSYADRGERFVRAVAELARKEAP